jgi:predicted O-methyltransferase YrrM
MQGPARLYHYVERLVRGRRDRPAATQQIAPIVDIPFPVTDISAPTCIAEIMEAPEFGETVRFFADNPAARNALVSPNAQALLYALLRNLRSDHAVEIGTYRASTTETMCRAFEANGCGVVHTVDPFGSTVVPHIIEKWPAELQRRVRFYPVNSMAFFADFPYRPDLVFIDGNHDYEFALFDLQSAARVINMSGLIVVDNIGQPGPFFAARRFCQDNPGWSEIGQTLSNYRDGYPFDAHRVTIINTDFCILRAPRHVIVDLRPSGFGVFTMSELSEISFVPVGEPDGVLHLQCILRTYSDPPIERTIEHQIRINRGDRQPAISFDPPILPTAGGVKFTAELWLNWVGSDPLILADRPILT